MTNTTDPDRPRRVLALFGESFLRRFTDRPSHKMCAAARWELTRREHEARRALLHAGHSTPLPAASVREGMVLRTRTRLVLVREAYVLPSTRILLGVSRIDLDGAPADAVEQFPLLAGDTWTYLVTRDAAFLAPYAVPMPAVGTRRCFPHFSGGVCEEDHCTTQAGYDGHEMWDCEHDFMAHHHTDGTVCDGRFGRSCDHFDHQSAAVFSVAVA
jgi:hypothetical protein